MAVALHKLCCNSRCIKRAILLGVCLSFIVLLSTIDQDIIPDTTTFLEQELNRSWQPANVPLWLNTMALTMEERRSLLRRQCERNGLHVLGNDTLHRPNPWEFLINRKHHVIWCNVFKSASTSWMYNFNILAGYSPRFLSKTKEVPLQLARKKYPRPSVEDLKQALNDSTSFLIVRHPFERLLSGYRDKMVYALPHTYHQNLGYYIISKYRPGMSTDKSLRKKTMHPKKTRQRSPTFSEFVQYLVDTYKEGKPFDMHWAPITTFCTPCQVRFDIIMKLETLEDDQNYLIHVSKLQRWIQPQWRNPSRDKSKTDQLIEKHYSQLSRRQVLQLYDIYKYDFDLFGYSLEEYLQYSKIEPEVILTR